MSKNAVQSKVTSSPLVLYNNYFMVRFIFRQRGGPAALKLTKLFGIDDFPAAKDSGKVLIIIIYCYLIIIINIVIIIIIIVAIIIIIIIIIITSETVNNNI